MFVCPLTQIKVGEKCRIRELLASPELCHRLKEMGFCESREVTVISKSLICEVCNTKIGLCSKLAEKIIVEKE